MNIKEISMEIYENNKAKGFWDNERNVGEMLMLVTSELSEALEADRKGKEANIAEFDYEMQNPSITPAIEENAFKNAFENNIKDSFEDEMADAAIRIFDICFGLGIDIEFHIEQKLRYNKLRAHMHGKKY